MGRSKRANTELLQSLTRQQICPQWRDRNLDRLQKQTPSRSASQFNLRRLENESLLHCLNLSASCASVQWQFLFFCQLEQLLQTRIALQGLRLRDGGLHLSAQLVDNRLLPGLVYRSTGTGNRGGHEKHNFSGMDCILSALPRKTQGDIGAIGGPISNRDHACTIFRQSPFTRL